MAVKGATAVGMSWGLSRPRQRQNTVYKVHLSIILVLVPIRKSYSMHIRCCNIFSACVLVYILCMFRSHDPPTGLPSHRVHVTWCACCVVASSTVQVLAVFRSFPFRAPAAATVGNGVDTRVEETQAPPPAYSTLVREPEEAGEITAAQADPENVGEDAGAHSAVRRAG